MRQVFAETIREIAEKDRKLVFLTGDLGFHAFEKLRDSMGERFINAGVAEHNMVTAAAGIAYTGLKPWIYSIAPFVTIKVLEEIRNDVCLPRLNVKIVGLGGGYDYGVAGPTHHALNDIAVMTTLPNMKIYTPGVAEDLPSIVNQMHKEDGPGYLRLTKAEKVAFAATPYQAVRRVARGRRAVVLALGSIINRILPAKDLDVWLVSELPFELPRGLLQSMNTLKRVVVVEEHGQTGGLGSYIQTQLREKELFPKKFLHIFAKGYISHTYGSRDFYLKESKLDHQGISESIKDMM